MNNLNLSRVVILLRGTSGSSKTTFAEYLKDIFYWNPVKSCEIVSADDYFTSQDGSYNFNAKDLGIAHNNCRQAFLTHIKNGVELIIVSNTNANEKQLEFYIDAAKLNGYTLFSLVMEKRFEGGNNGHNCPESSLVRQENNIKQSLKLR